MKRLSLVVALLAAGCSDDPASATGPADPTALAPPPEGQGFQLSLEATAPAFEETWICDVYPMPNPGLSHVNRVEVRQTEGTHHLTLSTLGLSGSGKVPHGRYDCDALYGDSSLMEDQIMFFGNQGSADDEMQLPDGVAATIPPALDVIHEMHYVNTTDAPVQLYSRINAWTIHPYDVESGIWGGSVRDEHIDIPPMAQHSEWSRCAFNEDVEVLFLASHTHALGVEFTVRPFDGETTGEIFYTNTDWHVPYIVQYDPPLVVPAGEGFEWTCTWNNTTDAPVSYGNHATDEMCNLAVVHTPFSTSARCEVVETSDGVLWKDPSTD